MIFDEIFQFLKASGLAPTHAVFSTDYLGHSPRYYDYLRCSGARPSLRSLLKLVMRLHDMGRAAATSESRAIAADFAKRVVLMAIAQNGD